MPYASASSDSCSSGSGVDQQGCHYGGRTSNEVGYTVHPVVPKHAHTYFRNQPPYSYIATCLEGAQQRRTASGARNTTAVSATTQASHVKNGLWVIFLQRDERVARQEIEWAQWMSALSLCPSPSHPAFLAAAKHIANAEFIDRRELMASEAHDFVTHLADPFRLQHRILTTDLAPLQRCLRRWLAWRRARVPLYERQRLRLVRRESHARDELLFYSDLAETRRGLFRHGILYLEAAFRHELDVLQLRTWCAMGTIAIRLQEQVARFPLLFGGDMAHTRVCGRVAGQTVFMRLAMLEAMQRTAVCADESRERDALPCIAAQRYTMCLAEPDERACLVQEEQLARAQVQRLVRALIAHYTRRDVEVYEYVERHWLQWTCRT